MAPALEERLLQRVQLAVRREAFDGANRLCRRPCRRACVQERIGLPSISTVQAPQRPSPQPYLQPVRSRSSRRTLSRLSLRIDVNDALAAVDMQFFHVWHGRYPRR